MSLNVESLSSIKLLLFRHAESRNNCLYEEIRNCLGESASNELVNAEEQKLRQPDSELSNRGKIQVTKLCNNMKLGGLQSLVIPDNISKWKAISSPMKRCLETSIAIRDGLDIDIEVNPLFYETGGCYKYNDSGTIEFFPGYTSDQIHQQYNRYECIPGMENGWDNNRNHKETEAEFDNRCKEISNYLWNICIENSKTNSLQGIIVIAHGNVLSGIINCLSDPNQARKMLFVHQNAAFSHLELQYDPVHSRKIALMKQFNNTNLLIGMPTLPKVEIEELCTGGHTIDDYWIQDFLQSDTIEE